MKQGSKPSSAALSLEHTIHLGIIRASLANARDMCKKAGLDFATIDVSCQEENRASDIDDDGASERSRNDTKTTFMVDAVVDAVVEEDGPHFIARMAMYDLDNADLLWEAVLCYQELSAGWGWYFEIGIKTDRDLHPVLGGRRLVFPKETAIELRRAMDVLKKMIEFFAQLPIGE